jgi:hypothetical protein
MKLGQAGDLRLLGGVSSRSRNDLLPAQISTQGQPADVVDWSVSAQDEEVEDWDRKVQQLSSYTRTCPDWEEAEDWTTFSHKAYCPYVARGFWSYKERSLHIADSEWEFFVGQAIPLYKISTFEKMLAKNFDYVSARDFHFFNSRLLGERDQKWIKDLGQTEHSKLLQSIRRENNSSSRDWVTQVVMVVLGNFEGQIIFFTDVMTMPDQIRELLTDPSIVKVGSGICCDLEELLHVDIRLRV